MQHIPDVSVVLPFGDDEDLIGTAVRRISAHLRECGLSFEIVAVDEHSGDNSHAVLGLLRPDMPELRIANAPGRGRGFASGAQRARGRTLWMIAATAAARSPLSPFGRAYRRVHRGELDLVMVERRFVVCHRTRALSAIDGLRGGGTTFQRRLLKRSLGRDLAVEQQVIGGADARGRWRAGAAPSQRALSRLLGALTPGRMLGW